MKYSRRWHRICLLGIRVVPIRWRSWKHDKNLRKEHLLSIGEDQCDAWMRFRSRPIFDNFSITSVNNVKSPLIIQTMLPVAQSSRVTVNNEPDDLMGQESTTDYVWWYSAYIYFRVNSSAIRSYYLLLCTVCGFIVRVRVVEKSYTVNYHFYRRGLPNITFCHNPVTYKNTYCTQ